MLRAGAVVLLLAVPSLASAQQALVSTTGGAPALVENSAATPALVSSSAAEPARSAVRYELHARVVENDLAGEETIEIDPQGAAQLSDVVLFLFPNLLTERLAGEDSKTFFSINPVRWRRGGITIESLTGDDGAALHWTNVGLSRGDDLARTVDLPANTAIRVALPAPATGTVRLHARFRVHVPERLGSFAWYHGELFLNGGWYPQVAPRDAAGRWDLQRPLPRADAEVTVDAPPDRWVILDRVIAPPDPKRGAVTAAISARPTVLLAVAREIHRVTRDDTVVLAPDNRRAYSKRAAASSARARDFLERHGFVAPDSAPLPMHEAPLSRELVFHDAPIAIVTSRIYRLFAPMRKYQDVHVARAQIAAEIRDRVYALEPGDDAGWVLDAATWYLAREWQSERTSMRDVREYVRPFAFLPAVDIVLNRPDFPFAAEFYDNFYYTDHVRDDVSRFNHDRPNGRVAWEKLIDLVGRETAGKAMEAYLHGTRADGGFRAVAARETGRDLTTFFAQWRGSLPLVNYKLARVRVRRSGDGNWISTIRMVREGDPIDEPVPIKVTEIKGSERVIFDSAKGSETLEVKTPRAPIRWTVDPDSRLRETSLVDNRIPPGWRGFLQYAYVDYDFKLNKLESAAGFTFERRDDLRNEIIGDFFYRQQSTGADVGYSHSAGQFSYYRGLVHRYGFLLIAQHLDEGFGKNGLHVVPGFDPTVSDVRDTSSVELFYRYDSREDWRFPRHGARLFAYVEAGRSVDGRASTFQLANLEVVKLARLSDNNVLALEGKAGTFLGTRTADVPLSKLFFLGGSDDVRGISAPDIVGPTRVLFSAEWRHYLLHDLDWNFYLERMRQLQGALFVDTGYIAPKTFEKDVHWTTAVGYGLREHYDFLGVRPQIFRLDIAQRVDDQTLKSPKLDLRIYIGAGQSF